MSNIRTNRYFNDPALGQAFSNLASLFAPPDSADLVNYATANAKNQDAARRAKSFSYIDDPNYSRDYADRMNYAINGNANDTFYKVDLGAKTDLEKQRIQEAGALSRHFLTPVPVKEGETVYMPEQNQAATGLPAVLGGNIKIGQGERVYRPDGSMLAGADKPMSEEQLKGLILQGLPEADQRAAVVGSVPVETIIQDGAPTLVRRNDAYGKQPYTEPTTDVRNYEDYSARESAQGRQPLNRLDYEKELKKAGSSQTTINTGSNSSKFVEESDKAAATRFSNYIDAAHTATQFTGDLKALADIGSKISTGKGAQLTAALGPYAKALGVDIDQLSEIEAYDAIVSRLVPMMRPAGSGAASDFDAKQFLASLPSIGRTPEGNRIVLETLDALQSHRVKSGEIASQAMQPHEAGGLSWQDAERQIRELGDPYEMFNAYRRRAGDAQAGRGLSGVTTGQQGAAPFGAKRTASGISWSIEP